MLRADKQIVLAAVRGAGSALQYASAELQDDKDVVLAAAMQDPTALLWASAALQMDEDVVSAMETAHTDAKAALRQS